MLFVTVYSLCKTNVFKFTINTVSFLVTLGFISAPSRTYTVGTWEYISWRISVLLALSLLCGSFVDTTQGFNVFEYSWET